LTNSATKTIFNSQESRKASKARPLHKSAGFLLPGFRIFKQTTTRFFNEMAGFLLGG